MRNFVLIAALAIVSLLPLTPALATPVPCGDACVVNPGIAPNVTLPGGFPGFELNTFGVTNHTVGPNVLIGLLPPGPPLNPADQSLVLADPTARLNDSSTCPGGCTRSLFFGLGSDPAAGLNDSSGCPGGCTRSLFFGLGSDPAAALNDSSTCPGGCSRTRFNFPLDSALQSLSGLSLSIINELPGVTTDVFVKTLGSNIAGFPGFSAFTLTFDLQSHASTNLYFSLFDGQSLGFAPATIPEPATLVLISTALVGLGVIRRRRRGA